MIGPRKFTSVSRREEIEIAGTRRERLWLVCGHIHIRALRTKSTKRMICQYCEDGA